VPIIVGDPFTNATAFLLSEIQAIQRAQGLPVAVPPLAAVEASTVNPTLIGGYGQNLRNLFSGDTYNIRVGVAIQFPFKNKTAEANLAGARIQGEQLLASTRSQQQIIEVDVRNSAQAVESSRQRVLSAREARVNAEMQLEGEQRLYQVGRSTTFLLFQRENALANARASELRAETDYNKALADLQRATSTTLRANNVIVETPAVP
jgi:outer membrane protein TolC